MLNYKRRKRQANENSDIIITEFAQMIQNSEQLYPGTYHIHNDAEFMALVGKVRDEVRAKANCIHPDWSIPIILEAIGRMYYGNQQDNKAYGPIFKRALVYLWDTNGDVVPVNKNLESLREVLRLCFVLEELYGYRKFFLISEEFSFTVEDGYVFCDEQYKPMIMEFARLIQGRGRRMRIADTNSQLMNEHAIEFFQALVNVLSGTEPSKIALFSGTFYEHIPGISDKECKKFWQSVFFRYVFYISTLKSECEDGADGKDFVPSVTLFPEFAIELPEGFFTQEIVEDTFWRRDWLRQQEDERYGNLIVERPIMRISQNGDFATCSVLIGDSINYFIESQILNYTSRSPRINLPPDVFKEAISAPFEDKVIDGLRELGFLAGHVTENGIWETQKGAINLNWSKDITLYGEVDALAYNPERNEAILVECKVLNDVRDYKSYKNIVAKLVDDSEGFRVKLRNKSKWVNQALSVYYETKAEAACVLLTDIPIPIVDSSQEDIILTYYERFILAIKKEV